MGLNSEEIYIFEKLKYIYISKKLFEKGFIISVNIDYWGKNKNRNESDVNLIFFSRVLITLILKLHELL